MRNRIIGIMKNLSYTLLSNIVSLLISSLIILIVPKLVGTEVYGYFQLYTFYAGYIGISHLGWNDGIYLRYGGEKYEEIDKKLFFSQFLMQLVFQTILGILLIIIANIITPDPNRQFILFMISIAMIISNLQNMLSYILQATNRIKEYSVVTITFRLMYFIILVFFLFANLRSYEYIIISEVMGRFISLLIAIYYCKDIVFRKLKDFYFDFKEIYINISVGIKLMISNLASMLVLGIVRFGVERNWSIETFGKVSLTLSVTNMMMIFINAIGVVLFPILRRINKEQYTNIYEIMRDFLMVISFGLLIIYYPVKSVLSVWLPEYSEALSYMAILFPVFIYEGKMSLLINTFLKTLRKEALLLKINIITLIFSSILTIITAYFIRDLDLTVLSIVVLLSFRAIFAEYEISKLLDIEVSKDIILEIILTVVFISSGWIIDSWLTPIIYSVFYLSYIFIKRNDLKYAYTTISILMKKD